MANKDAAMPQTPHLLLQQWREEDFEPFAQLCADPTVMAYFPSTLTRAESRAFAEWLQTLIEERGRVCGRWNCQRLRHLLVSWVCIYPLLNCLVRLVLKLAGASLRHIGLKAMLAKPPVLHWSMPSHNSISRQ